MVHRYCQSDMARTITPAAMRANPKSLGASGSKAGFTPEAVLKYSKNFTIVKPKPSKAMAVRSHERSVRSRLSRVRIHEKWLSAVVRTSNRCAELVDRVSVISLILLSVPSLKETCRLECFDALVLMLPSLPERGHRQHRCKSEFLVSHMNSRPDPNWLGLARENISFYNFRLA